MSALLTAATFRAVIGVCSALACITGCASALPGTSAGNADVAQVTLLRSHISWMSPAAKNMTLMYVTDLKTDDVYAYSYADGSLQGTLTGFKQPWAICVDGQGDIFVTDRLAAKIVEYAHAGKRPIKKLADPNLQPGGCAVDPRTGNLAVANISTPGSLPGNLAIFKHATGKAKAYKTPAISYYQYCAYDANGDLYVDGQAKGAFGFASLPYGTTKLVGVTLDVSPQFGGSVQWDGTHVAVQDYEKSAIDEYSVSGTSGELAATTLLGSASYAVQVWIDGATVVGANATGGSVMYWNYPAGGAPVNTISGLQEPWGIVVSPAQ